MKKSGLLLALSTLAGALLVGGTFAAWTVTDNANPFGITISADPTDVEIPEEGTITLAWGETRTLNAIEGMKRGDEKGPYSVGLLATTSDASAYDGTLTATLSSEATTEAKLIDYLEVKVYDNNTKEGAALLTANKASSYTGAANITVTSAEEKVVYFYVSLAEDIADDVWNVINDNTVTLTVDWKEKAAAPEEIDQSAYYVVGSFNEWTANNAYKMSLVEEGHYQIAGLAFEANAELKVNRPDLGDDGWFTSANYAGADATVLEGGNIKVNSAGTFTVDYYVDGTNGNCVILTKESVAPVEPEEPEEEFVYFVVGTFNEWTPANEYGMTKIDDNHYQLTDLVLEADAELKINNPELGDNGWFSSNNYAGDATVAQNGNIKVTTAGTYTVDYYVNGTNGNCVVLTKQA